MKTLSMKRPVTVGILLFPSVEELDFAGPYEVFANASDENGQSYCRVITVGTEQEIRCRGGLRVLSDHLLKEDLRLDLLVVPGDPMAREDYSNANIVTFLHRQREQTSTIASICTGAFFLASAGLLNQRRATTHTTRIELLRQHFPHIDVVEEKIVDTDEIVTAGGISSGIDLALYFLEKWFGPEARQREAKRLDGPWF
jgi:transcriptional regulator GlxA family with amidase domain